VLSFFIAGLLYLLCFEHVDNLGAYSIPSETGLLIPSDYSNYLGANGDLFRQSSWEPQYKRNRNSNCEIDVHPLLFDSATSNLVGSFVCLLLRVPQSEAA